MDNLSAILLTVSSICYLWVVISMNMQIHKQSNDIEFLEEEIEDLKIEIRSIKHPTGQDQFK
mgnify:CR=1 FL=1